MARSKLKWIGIGALGFVVLMLSVVVLLLTRSYDSQRLGQRLLAQISTDDFQVTAAGFTFHPLSGLEMTGVEVRSAIPDGVMTATIDDIIVTHEVKPLLSGRLVFTEIVLERPAMEVVWSTAPAALPADPAAGGPAGGGPA
ncbi:MAG: hypothetical protein AAGF23_07115, partial [Acidobacteriota bacterium]